MSIDKAGCFPSIALHMYCCYIRSVVLLHDAVGWSAVCDCGISGSYSLTIRCFWYGLIFNVPVNSNCHVGTVSSCYKIYFPVQAWRKEKNSTLFRYVCL